MKRHFETSKSAHISPVRSTKRDQVNFRALIRNVRDILGPRDSSNCMRDMSGRLYNIAFTSLGPADSPF